MALPLPCQAVPPNCYSEDYIHYESSPQHMCHFKALFCELSIMELHSLWRAVPPDCYSEDFHLIMSALYMTIDRVVITITSTLYRKNFWRCSRRIIVIANCSHARNVFRIEFPHYGIFFSRRHESLRKYHQHHRDDTSSLLYHGRVLYLIIL